MKNKCLLSPIVVSVDVLSMLYSVLDIRRQLWYNRKCNFFSSASASPSSEATLLPSQALLPHRPNWMIFFTCNLWQCVHACWIDLSHLLIDLSFRCWYFNRVIWAGWLIDIWILHCVNLRHSPCTVWHNCVINFSVLLCIIKCNDNIVFKYNVLTKWKIVLYVRNRLH